MSPLASEFFALFVYGTAIVLLHELGHALFAPLGGYKVTSLGLDSAPSSGFQSGGLVVYIGRIGLVARAMPCPLDHTPLPASGITVVDSSCRRF